MTINEFFQAPLSQVNGLLLLMALHHGGEGPPEWARTLTSLEELPRFTTDLDIMMTADCVIQIVVPEGVVNDKAQIMEFVPTLRERDLKLISDRLTELNSAGINKDTPVKCSHCQHEWTTQAEFDPASFFAVSS